MDTYKAVCVTFVYGLDEYGDQHEWQQNDIPIPTIGSRVTLWSNRNSDGSWGSGRERGEAVAVGIVDGLEYTYVEDQHSVFTTYVQVILKEEALNDAS